MGVGVIDSAVNGMTFGHDIVLGTEQQVGFTTAEPTNGILLSTQPVAAQPKVLTKNASVPAPGAVNSMLTQLHSHSLPTPETVASALLPSSSADYKDPLRELVLISEAICVSDTAAYQTNVKSLAKEATVLEHIREVHPEQAGLMPLSPAPLGGHYAATTPAAAAAPLATKLNLFQDPKDMVDPVKEREFLKKLEALDDDSEGFDGKHYFFAKIIRVNIILFL